MPRPLLAVAVAALVLALAGAHGFRIEEASVDSIQLGFNNGSLTSVDLVRFYLDRISRLNRLLHAVIEVNPDALPQAARADAARCTACPSCSRTTSPRATRSTPRLGHSRFSAPW